MKNVYKIVIAGAVVILILAGIALEVWSLGCRREIYKTIGDFESREAGLRAAIPHLAAEIRRCPEAELYRIVWRSSDTEGHKDVDQRALLYARKAKAIGYEHDVFSGISGKAYIVAEAAIKAVAEKRGSLEDFSEYDLGRR
ncbi:MAG: hypothetical protein AB1631_13070 [Acidobacteriota bacterium]